MLIDADIAYKDTLILHGLLFYVYQDFPLMLIDTDSVHKDILFHHELLFCARQDVPLMLVDTTLFTRVFIPL